METYTEAFGQSFSPSDLAAHLERNLSAKNFERILDEDTVLVTEVDDHLVGFVQFGGADMGAEAVADNDRELRRLYVHADFQNWGIGTRRMDAALAHPGLKAADRIILDAWEHHHGAQRFYAQPGFEVVGERKSLVKSGLETSLDLIMVRRRTALKDTP